MLENMWLRDEFENKYLNVFLFSVFFTVISVLISRYTINLYGGLISIFIASLAAAYPIASYLRVRENEEEENIRRHTEVSLLKRHEREYMVYLSFFFGTLIVFTIAGMVMPESFFSIQAKIIEGATGAATMANSEAAAFWPVLTAILTNNLRVLTVTFMISFAISAGMVFVVVWNSSVLGFLLSGIVRNQSISAIAHLPFGIVEISCFAIAGLAGALLSHQFDHYAKGHYEKRVFTVVLKDVMFLLSGGVAVIIASGIVETALIL